jgi:hypothetical protein
MSRFWRRPLFFSVNCFSFSTVFICRDISSFRFVGGEPFFSTTRAMTTEGHPGELATVFSPLILG